MVLYYVREILNSDLRSPWWMKLLLLGIIGAIGFSVYVALLEGQVKWTFQNRWGVTLFEGVHRRDESPVFYWLSIVLRLAGIPLAVTMFALVEMIMQ